MDKKTFSYVVGACSREKVTSETYRWNNLKRTQRAQTILQYTVAGAGCIKIRKHEYLLKEGDLFVAFIPESSEYWFDKRYAVSWDFCWINIEGLATELWRSLTQRWGRVIRFPMDSDPVVELSRIINDYEVGDHSSEMSMSIALYSHYVTCRGFLENEISVVSSCGARLKKKIDGSYRKQINLKELCAFLGVSREHLTREFRKLYKTEPSLYLRRKRVENAELLLRQSMLTTEEIARRSGFSNTRQMQRAFQELRNSLPSSYRRKFFS